MPAIPLIVAFLIGPVQEDGLAAPLEALIERVNALEAFHVVYDFDSQGPEGERHSTLELAYRAPDLGRMRLEDEEGATEMWFDADGVFARNASDGTWRRATRPDWPPAATALEELFPRRTALEPGVVFFLHLKVVDDTDTVETQTSIQQRLGGRDCPLAWLPELREHADEVERQEDGWLVEQDGVRTLLSAEHGFPLRIDARTPDKTVAVRLTAVHLDDDCAPAALTLPGEALKAAEDEDLGRLQAAQMAPPAQRRNGYERLQRLLDGGTLEWTALTRSRWSTVLTELHRAVIEPGATRQLEATRSLCAAFAAHVRQELEKDDSPQHREALREYVTTNRADLRKKLELGEGYLGQFPALEPRGLEFDERLFEAEREVVQGLFEELLVAPALLAFDEALEGLLDG